MVDVKRESSVYQQLCREAGVAIARPFPPLTTYARITIGTMDEMKRALPLMIPLLAAPARTTRPAASGAPAPHSSKTSTAVDRSRTLSCTRRTFLERVGQAGGGVAVHGAMRALGLAGAPAAAWSPPAVRAPAGTRVIVLGAGVAGLAAAYELRKLGYECEILEARSRFGGRCFTVRRGQVSEEAGTPPQKAAFDPDLYLERRRRTHSSSPYDHARLLSRARRRDRALLQRQRGGVPLSVDRRSVRAAAPPARGAHRLARPDVGAPRQGRLAGRPRSTDDRRGPRAHSRVAAPRGRLEPGTALRGLASPRLLHPHLASAPPPPSSATR